MIRLSFSLIIFLSCSCAGLANDEEAKKPSERTPRTEPVIHVAVTTNAKEREKNPIENTWGALHEYHHVFQMAHCDTKQSRSVLLLRRRRPTRYRSCPVP